MKIVVLDGYTMNPGDNPWDEVAKLGGFVCHAIGGVGSEKFVSADHACTAVRLVPCARAPGANNAHAARQPARILNECFICVLSVTPWP